MTTTDVPGAVPDSASVDDDAVDMIAGARGSGSRSDATHVVRVLASDACATSNEKTTASCQLYRLSRTRTECQRIKNDGGYRTLVQCVRATETALLQNLFAVGCLLHMHDHLGLASDLDELQTRLLPDLDALLPPSPLADAVQCERLGDDAVADVLTRLTCVVEVFPASRTALQASEWLPLVVAFLDTGSPHLVTESLVLVRLLAQGDSANQHMIAASGAVPRLVSLMAVGSEAHATHAAAAIVGLADTNAATSAALVAAGAVPPLVALLRTGTHEANAYAAHALTAVASDPDAITVMEQAGAILPLVDLPTNRDHALALAATLALAALATTDYTRIVIGRTGGAITALVQLVSVGSNPQRTAAALALAQLTTHSDNRTAVVTAGAIVPLVHAVATGTTNDSLQPQQHHALCALEHLADRPDHRTEMARAGLIPTLIEYVRSNASYMVRALALLTAWTQDDASSRSAMVDAGLVEFLVTSLRGSGSGRDADADLDPLVVAGALDTLRRLAICDANLARLAALGALERVVYFAGHNSDSRDAQQAIALDVVVRFATVKDHHAALATAGGIEVIADRLRQASIELTTTTTTTTTTTMTMLFAALGSLSANRQCLPQLERVGAIELCVAQLTRVDNNKDKHRDDATTVAAVRVLTHLAVRSDLAVRIVQAGAIAPLKMLLLTDAAPNGKDGTLVLAAVESVVALAAVEANRTAIADVHVVDAVVELIERSNRPLKTALLDVLIERVAASDDPVVVHALLKCRPVEYLVERLKDGSTRHDTTQLFVTQRALGYLAAAATDKVLIMAATAVEPLVRLLPVSQGDVGADAAVLLQLFATKRGYHAAMLHAGAVALLLTMVTSGSATESECAAGALSTLALEADTTVQLVRSGIVARLVATIRDNATPVRTTAALRVLNSLTIVHQASQSIADANAVPLLLEFLRSSSASLAQRLYVAEILVGLSNTSIGRSALLATPGTVDLAMLVVQTSAHGELRESCAVLLAQLAVTGFVQGAVVVSTGVLRLLVANVDAADDDTRKRAIAMVCRLLTVRALRPLVCDAGGHTALRKRAQVGSKDDAMRAAIGFQHVSLLDTLWAELCRRWRQRGKRHVHVEATETTVATVAVVGVGPVESVTSNSSARSDA